VTYSLIRYLHETKEGPRPNTIARIYGIESTKVFEAGLVCTKAKGSNDIVTGAAVNVHVTRIIAMNSNVILISPPI